MKLKKIALSVAAVLTMTATTGLVGCSGGGETIKKPDANETTYIKLLHYNAGFGKEYLDPQS